MKYDAGAGAYDLLTGRWSKVFAPPAIEKARIGPHDRVLDVATGTGDAAMLARRAVGTAGHCVGVDTSLPMLQVAAFKSAADPVDYVGASAMALPFRAGAFDAVLCQFGLMFFPDRGRALAEFRRVLRPEGRLALAVWGTPERAAFAGFVAQALAERLPDLAEELLRPFSMSSPDELHALMIATGFAGVDVAAVRGLSSFDSFDDYWAPYEQGGGRLGQAHLSLLPDEREIVRRRVRERLRAHSTDGRITLPLEAFVAVGVA